MNKRTQFITELEHLECSDDAITKVNEFIDMVEADFQELRSLLAIKCLDELDNIKTAYDLADKCCYELY